MLRALLEKRYSSRLTFANPAIQRRISWKTPQAVLLVAGTSRSGLIQARFARDCLPVAVWGDAVCRAGCLSLTEIAASVAHTTTLGTGISNPKIFF